MYRVAGLSFVGLAVLRDYTRDVGTTVLHPPPTHWHPSMVLDLREHLFNGSFTYRAIQESAGHCVETKRIAELAEAQRIKNLDLGERSGDRTIRARLAMLYVPTMHLTRRALLRHGHLWLWSKAWCCDSFVFLVIMTQLIAELV